MLNRFLCHSEILVTFCCLVALNGGLVPVSRKGKKEESKLREKKFFILPKGFLGGLCGLTFAGFLFGDLNA